MNISFQGCVPVRYYAQSPESGEFRRLYDEKNIHTCQDRIIRILNGTIDDDSDAAKELVDFFEKQDPEYEYQTCEDRSVNAPPPLRPVAYTKG